MLNLNQTPKKVQIHESVLIEILGLAGITEVSTDALLQLINSGDVSEKTVLEFIKSARVKPQSQMVTISTESLVDFFKAGQPPQLTRRQLVASTLVKVVLIIFFGWLVMTILNAGLLSFFLTVFLCGITTLINKVF